MKRYAILFLIGICANANAKTTQDDVYYALTSPFQLLSIMGKQGCEPSVEVLDFRKSPELLVTEHAKFLHYGVCYADLLMTRYRNNLSLTLEHFDNLDRLDESLDLPDASYLRQRIVDNFHIEDSLAYCMAEIYFNNVLVYEDHVNGSIIYTGILFEILSAYCLSCTNIRHSDRISFLYGVKLLVETLLLTLKKSDDTILPLKQEMLELVNLLPQEEEKKDFPAYTGESLTMASAKVHVIRKWIWKCN